MMNRTITIYSTSWCQPCRLAKRLLESKGLSYTEIDIEEKGWSREDLNKITGGRTVPQIVINENTGDEWIREVIYRHCMIIQA